MKIKNNVIEKYQFFCPFSTNKCDSFSEIEYKIERCVTLGTVIELRPNKEIVVRYFMLNFVLRKGVVVDMYKDKESAIVYVSEKLKDEYDRVNGKIVV